MEPALFFGVCGLVTAAAVVFTALVIGAVPRAAGWGTGKRLAVAHTALVLAALAVAPLVIVAMRDSPYGDLYLPYFVVPGLHIDYPAQLFFGTVVFPWLLGYMESFPASVLTVIVGPGLVGLLAGGAQWYAVGGAWDWLGGRVA
jgi:hypothetical protein